MTMTPDSFRDELDRATDAAPPAPPVVTDLEAGRARLRRRRWTAAVTAAAAVVVVAGGVGVATRGGAEDRGADPIAPPSTSQAPVQVPMPPSDWNSDRIVAACKDLPPGYFDARPRVVTATATAVQVLAVFASGDGRYWAECSIPLGDPEDDAATVVPYDSQGDPQTGFMSTFGPGCPPAEWSGCRLYSYGAVDRVSPEVSGVEVELSGGDTIGVETTDGYYVINLLLPLPSGLAFDQRGRLEGLTSSDLVRRITYLDIRTGAPLAAAMLDGSGGGDSGMQVDGLPVAFDAYPTMRGDF